MSVILSTGARNKLAEGFPLRQLFLMGHMIIRSGSAPATADAADTGTLLVDISQASGAQTRETRAAGTVQLTGGAAGSVNSILVADNAGGGIEILAVLGLGTIAFDTSLIVTAATCVARINQFNPIGIWAVTDGGATPIITLTAPLSAGAVTWGVTSSSTTITTTDGNFSGGVAPVNGIQWSLGTAGVISNSGVWSGTVAATGVAGYWRIYGSVVDAYGSSTTAIRVQGTCGTSGADYNMGFTTLTLATTHTVNTGSLTIPASS